MLQWTVLSLCLSMAFVAANPDWTEGSYTVKGYISLPYGNIIEPFEAWVDPTTERSRIDYYNGMNSILYINGPGYKIVPSPPGSDSKVTCYNVSGGIGFQSVLPVLTDFKLVTKNAICYYKFELHYCYIYRYSDYTMDKVNIYDMYILDDMIPVYFNFTGYDRLMGSHYDEYIFNYTDFTPGPIPMGVFDEAARFKKCDSYPGPGVSQTELDPMAEFMGGIDSEKNDRDTSFEFEAFKSKYSKTYNGYIDHESRKSIFRQARRFIHSKNRENLGFKLAINHLADHTEEELKLRNGHIYSGIGEEYRLKSNEVPLTDIDISDSMNWTQKGAVNPPKDQGICGSCWSFGTTGTLEGSYFIKNNTLLDLSEQSLIDCTWDQGDNGCDGGETERVGRWLLEPEMGHCVVTRDKYSSAAKQDDEKRGYLMADGICHWKETNKDVCVKIQKIIVTPQGDVSALRQFSAMRGPIQVAIDASCPTFSFYSGGVYYDPKCKNGPGDLDHSVLLVGYGTENGQDYWLVKNSWSTHWGDLGYIKMSTKDNNCGVATDAVFFILS